MVTFMIALLVPENDGFGWWWDRWRERRGFPEAVAGSVLITAAALSAMLVPAWYCVHDPQVEALLPLIAAGVIAATEAGIGVCLVSGVRLARLGFFVLIPSAVAGAVVAGATSGAPTWAIAVAASIWLVALPFLARPLAARLES